MAMIEQSNADFVCLQEVTHPFMHQHLLTNNHVREKYFISGNTLPNYGVLILSRFPCKFYEMPLNSKMGRSMLICQPIINYGYENLPTAVATVHLESGG